MLLYCCFLLWFLLEKFRTRQRENNLLKQTWQECAFMCCSSAFRMSAHLFEQTIPEGRFCALSDIPALIPCRVKSWHGFVIYKQRSVFIFSILLHLYLPWSQCSSVCAKFDFLWTRWGVWCTFRQPTVTVLSKHVGIHLSTNRTKRETYDICRCFGVTCDETSRRKRQIGWPDWTWILLHLHILRCAGCRCDADHECVVIDYFTRQKLRLLKVQVGLYTQKY